MKRLYIDLETRSTADPAKCGGAMYAADASSRILIYAYAYDDEAVITSTEPTQEFLDDLCDPQVLKIAHNAPFDRAMLSEQHFAGIPLPYTQWCNTQVLAGASGLPLKLDKIAKSLGLGEKAEQGENLINFFSKPKKVKGELCFNEPEDHEEKFQSFKDYAVQDVELLRKIHKLLPPLSDTERKIELLDTKINDRGVLCDVSTARVAAQLVDTTKAELAASLSHLGVDNARSVQQVKAALAERGLVLASLREDAVVEALAKTEDPEVKQILHARLAVNSTALAKIHAMLAYASDDTGRMRGLLNFYGAHTGRWAGRGPQPQNLPRHAVDDVDQVLADINRGVKVPLDDIKGIIRSLLVGPFMVADYSAIEARVLAWLSGEAWVLEAFNAGRDIYVETAERMGGLTRQQGKTAVLGCGYGAGAKGLAGSGFKGDEDEAWKLVHAWRAANPSIVEFWRKLGNLPSKTSGCAGRIRGSWSVDDFLLTLPSGRSIRYRNMRRENGELTFDSSKGFREHTHGGKMAENVTQAVARDILANGLLELERHGYRTVLHVHDEVVVEGSGHLRNVERLITRKPQWADGLPLTAEGYECERYRKG